MNKMPELPPLDAALAADMATTYESLIANGKTGAEAMQAVFVQFQIATSWTPAATLPDDDITVMLALSDGEVWQGYRDGEIWRDTHGMPLVASRVTHWMHTPAHPEPEAKAAPIRTSTGMRCASCCAKVGEGHAGGCPELQNPSIESWHTGLPLPGEPACASCDDTGTSFGKACTCAAAKGGGQ